ncbi:MAG: response regulator [Pseudomonadota bacterium]
MTCSNDPIEALEGFEADPQAWEVVISDHVMPHMVGTDLIARVKTLRPDCAAILCTGFADGAIETAALKAGADAVLLKPIEPQRIAEVLRENSIGGCRRSWLAWCWDRDSRTRSSGFIGPQLGWALCRDPLGAPRRDRQRGKSDPDGRSSAGRSRRGERAAELAHEDGDKIGPALFGELRRFDMLHTDPVIGDGELDLVADLFDAQPDEPDAAGKRMLDGVGRQLVDQQPERYGPIGVDIQRLGLDLDLDARCGSKQARRHRLGDFPEIGVDRDGLAARRLRDQIVKLGDGRRCAPAWLDSPARTGLPPIWLRR